MTYLFDRYADTFEQSLSGLGYQGPVLIAKLLQASGFAPRKQLNILDAGCGTGLCAPALLPYAARLTGVDLSPAMVERLASAVTMTRWWSRNCPTFWVVTLRSLISSP